MDVGIGQEVALSAFVLGSALGGVVAAVVLTQRMKMRLAVSGALGFIGVLVIFSSPSAPPLGWWGPSILIGVGLTCATALIVTAFFRFWRFMFDAPALRNFLRTELMPHAWGHPGAPPLPAKALATRWFITIAAATGSVVGVLMTKEEFWRSALTAIDPRHIVFTLLLTTVSISLIGPLEEYVFGQRLARSSSESHEEGGTSGNLITDVWENFSWRAAGRLALVALFSFLPTILHTCIDEAVSGREANTTLDVLFAAVAPAFTTYYWCAALQRGERSVARKAGRATTLFSAVLCSPTVLLFCLFFGFAMMARFPMLRENLFRVVCVFVLALSLTLFLSVALGFIMDGAGAFVGGWIIEFTRRTPALSSWHALALIGLYFCASATILNVLGDLMMSGFSKAPSAALDAWFNGPLSAVGWMAGLAVSGFPKILSMDAPPLGQQAKYTAGPNFEKAKV